MKVLLLADVRGVGRRGDVKEVSEGYGRNFLIARKLATIANSNVLGAHETIISQRAANEAQRLEKAHADAAKIEGQTVTFLLRTDKQGTVFGSVKHEEILRAIADEFGATPDFVVSPVPALKTTGDHVIVVSWKAGPQARIVASVRPQS